VLIANKVGAKFRHSDDADQSTTFLKRDSQSSMLDDDDAFELILEDMSLTIPKRDLSAMYKSFTDSHTSPYQVQSQCSGSVFRSFVAAILGVPITIATDSVATLSLLADEFRFTRLLLDISANSLSALLESERRLFLCDWDRYNESLVCKMLILVRENAGLARNALDQLGDELPTFASSTPIHTCPEVATIRRVFWSAQRPPGFRVLFGSDGGVLYSFTSDDCRQYAGCIVLSAATECSPIAQDMFPGCPDEITEFWQAKWKVDEQAESVFVAQGLSADTDEAREREVLPGLVVLPSIPAKRVHGPVLRRRRPMGRDRRPKENGCVSPHIAARRDGGDRAVLHWNNVDRRWRIEGRPRVPGRTGIPAAESSAAAVKPQETVRGQPSEAPYLWSQPAGNSGIYLSDVTIRTTFRSTLN
jgi:hypothetical protein